MVIAVSDEDAYDDHDDDDKDDDEEEKDEEDECGFCQSLDLDVGFTKLDKAIGCWRTQCTSCPSSSSSSSSISSPSSISSSSSYKYTHSSKVIISWHQFENLIK